MSDFFVRGHAEASVEVLRIVCREVVRRSIELGILDEAVGSAIYGRMTDPLLFSAPMPQDIADDLLGALSDGGFWVSASVYKWFSDEEIYGRTEPAPIDDDDLFRWLASECGRGNVHILNTQMSKQLSTYDDETRVRYVLSAERVSRMLKRLQHRGLIELKFDLSRPTRERRTIVITTEGAAFLGRSTND